MKFLKKCYYLKYLKNLFFPSLPSLFWKLVWNKIVKKVISLLISVFCSFLSPQFFFKYTKTRFPPQIPQQVQDGQPPSPFRHGKPRLPQHDTREEGPGNSYANLKKIFAKSYIIGFSSASWWPGSPARVRPSAATSSWRCSSTWGGRHTGELGSEIYTSWFLKESTSYLDTSCNIEFEIPFQLFLKRSLVSTLVFLGFLSAPISYDLSSVVRTKIRYLELPFHLRKYSQGISKGCRSVKKNPYFFVQEHWGQDPADQPHPGVPGQRPHQDQPELQQVRQMRRALLLKGETWHLFPNFEYAKNVEKESAYQFR